MWARLFPKARLRCDRKLWIRLTDTLRARGDGISESGAFLLGRRDGDRRTIVDFIPYDDVDPLALRGMIEFDGAAMDAVWSHCDERHLEVVADIHTHPRGYGQSSIDRANPMIAERGHIALIMPHFAKRAFGPGEIGIYELVGPNQWIDHSARGHTFFELKGKP